MDIRQCRGCDAEQLIPVLDLGTMPPAHRFRRPEAPRVPDSAEVNLPLRLALCEACGLAQLADDLPAQLLEEDDPSEQSRGNPPAGAGALRLATPERIIISQPPLSRVGNLRNFLEHLRRDLAQDEVAVLESRHLAYVVEQTAFDLIQHRHWHYFSLHSLQAVLALTGFKLVDVEPEPLALGWLVVHVARTDSTAPDTSRVAATLQLEHRLRLHEVASLQAFATRVAQVKADLWAFLQEADRFGQTFAGYGATARGNTLLAYCGLGTTHLPYIVDANPALHGLETPGHCIPITAPVRLLDDMPDITLVLSWDQADAAIRDQLEYRRRGGRLASPVPMTRLISVAA